MWFTYNSWDLTKKKAKVSHLVSHYITQKASPKQTGQLYFTENAGKYPKWNVTDNY